MSAPARAQYAKRAALAALFAFCAAFGGLAHAQGQTPVARPEVKVGDRWTYRRVDHWTDRVLGHYELRVTFAGDKAILAVVKEHDGRESDASYTSEWNATVSALDQAIVSPHAGFLGFPLQIGASYRSSFTQEATRFRGEYGARGIAGVQSATYRYTVKVHGWEEIVVPAGKFRTLKIEAEGFFDRSVGAGIGGPARGLARTEIWYAPEVKRWVKYRYEDAIRGAGAVLSPNNRIGEELTAFRLQ